MASERLHKSILHIALPVSVGFLFNTLFNVVDTYWAGQISAEALAALSATFPVFFLIIALGNGFSVGATALIANAYGEDQKHKGLSYYFHSIIVSIMIAVVMALSGRYIADWILAISHIPAAILPMAREYIYPTLAWSPWFIAPFALNSILSAQGKTKPLRNSMIAGFFINALLNPWFLYGGFGIPAMGMSGIAYATITVQVITSLYLFWEVYRRGDFLHFYDFIRGKSAHIGETINLMRIKKLSAQAVPSIINYLLIIVGSLVLFYYMSSFGDKAFSAYSIALRIEQIALLPAIGLSVAALSLTGRLNGEKNYHGIKKVLNACVRIGAWFTLPAGVLILLFGSWISSLFTEDAEVVQKSFGYLIPASLGLWAYTVIFISGSVFQGMKKPLVTLLVNITRQILLPMLIFTIILHWFDMTLNTLWYVTLAITIGAALYSYHYASKLVDGFIKKQTEQETARD